MADDAGTGSSWAPSGGRAMTGRQLVRPAQYAAFPVILLAVWQACAQIGFVRRSVLPAPTDVALVWYDLITGATEAAARYSGTWFEPGSGIAGGRFRRPRDQVVPDESNIGGRRQDTTADEADLGADLPDRKQDDRKRRILRRPDQPPADHRPADRRRQR